MFTTALVFSLLFFLFYFLGGGFFIIIPIYISISLIFFQQASADKGLWGLSAMSFSNYLMGGRRIRSLFTFGFIALMYFVALATMNSLGTALGVGSNMILHLLFFLATQFVLAFFSLVFALWYFDILNIQKQSLDLLRDKVADFIFKSTDPGKKDDDSRD